MDIEEHSRNAIPQDWQWDGLLRALKRHGKTKNAILYPDKASGNFTNNGAFPFIMDWPKVLWYSSEF